MANDAGLHERQVKIVTLDMGKPFYIGKNAKG